MRMPPEFYAGSLRKKEDQARDIYTEGRGFPTVVFGIPGLDLAVGAPQAMKSLLQCGGSRGFGGDGDVLLTLTPPVFGHRRAVVFLDDLQFLSLH